VTRYDPKEDEMCGACSMQEMCTKFWSESQKGRDLLQGMCVDGRIILEWVLNKCGMRAWMISSGLVQNAVAGCCKYGKEA
jgi:hypothetical protein